MGLRFQTRLMLTVSALVLMTVVVMILLNIWTVTATEIRNYQDTGRLTTTLATSNLAYTVEAEKAAATRVQEQMVFSALLAAEFISYAEEDLHAPHEDLANVFANAIERSNELYGRALIEDIQVTDENGEPYIYISGEPQTFLDDDTTQPQSSPFFDLLTGEEQVVIQEPQPRDTDHELFSYVGVSGVDKPRIVQVGVGSDSIGNVSPYATVQEVVEGFYEALDVSRIAVVDKNGMVRASADNGSNEAGAESIIVRKATQFIESGEQFKLDVFGDDIGVYTPLVTWGEDGSAVLYIQYQTAGPVASIRNNITFISLIGIITLAISLLVCIYLSRSFARPLAQLADGVRAFGRGQLEHRVHLRSHDEIQDLAQTFNAMAGSIQDYMQELAIEAKRRERLESELRIAAEMQASLLPEEPPELEGLHLVGWSESAKEVGGDFYDFIQMSDGRLGIALGDATGKGLPAALLSSECWSTFQALAETCSSPGELLYRTNNALCRRLGNQGRFVTLFFMIIDPRSGKVSYASAGHNPPVMVRGASQRPEWLQTEGGFPLGLFADKPYPDTQLQMEPGDTILIYSDGLTEAHNPDNELYGEERVESVLAEHAPQELHETMEAMRADVRRHMDGRDSFDDMTLVGIRYDPAEEALAAS